MHPATRTQADGKGDEASAAAAIRFDAPENKDVTRQEFKDETDLNVLLKRFGVDSLVTRDQPTFQIVDYDIDLSTALLAISETHQAYQQMPHDIKVRYPTWQQFITALDTGELVLRNEPAPEPPAPET